MKAVLRNVRIAPKKVSIVAGLVRRKSVNEAIAMLKSLSAKKAAKPLREVIQSAAANAAHNFKQKRENLYIEQLLVTEARTLKRFNPVSRGRAHPILKRASHITVEVGVRATDAVASAKAPTSKDIKKEKESTPKS